MAASSSLKVTILGCGSSGGVPRPGPAGWGACDPQNPKNRRLRCSILVERKDGDKRTRVLIDTSPDLREQLLASETDYLDAVLYTHMHADHTHGIDDLRPLVMAWQRCIPIYADKRTGDQLWSRFDYCFETPKGSNYPPILEYRLLDAGKPVDIKGEGGAISFEPLPVRHGEIPALGFKMGGFVYLPDVSAVPDEIKDRLHGLDILILDALRYKPHPSHFNLADALELIAEVKPRKAVLTNLHNDLDYEELRTALPDGVVPAFDGMIIVN